MLFANQSNEFLSIQNKFITNKNSKLNSNNIMTEKLDMSAVSFNAENIYNFDKTNFNENFIKDNGKIDARSRFTHTKALFEQLERCNSDLPSFYSPRLQRSATVPIKTNQIDSSTLKTIPIVPPKPPLKHTLKNDTSKIFLTKNNSNNPFSEVTQNFLQLTSDLEKITTSSKKIETNKKKDDVENTEKNFFKVTSLSQNFFPTKSKCVTSSVITSPHKTDSVSNNKMMSKTENNFEPYWREASFYKKRLGVDTNEIKNDGFEDMTTEDAIAQDDDHNLNSESGESIPSEPHPTVPNVSLSVNSNFVQDQSLYCNNTNHQLVVTKATETLNKNDIVSKNTSFMLIRHMKEQLGLNENISVDNNKNKTNTNVLSNKKVLNNFNFEKKKQKKSTSTSNLSLSDLEENVSGLVNKTNVKYDLKEFDFLATMETLRGLSPEQESFNRKVSFSTAPIKVFKTHGIEEYDRRNEEIDPVASCAEYELERRLDKMNLFDVELIKGPEGLGVSIIGMGVGADAGLEKLGIFVKSITPGGAVHRDGRIHVCDQIVSVDGISLVGVSQLFAAQTLRATSSRVIFTIGRETNLEDSEVVQLIQQSLEQDRLKLIAQQTHAQQQLNNKIVFQICQHADQDNNNLKVKLNESKKFENNNVNEKLMQPELTSLLNKDQFFMNEMAQSNCDQINHEEFLTQQNIFKKKANFKCNSNLLPCEDKRDKNFAKNIVTSDEEQIKEQIKLLKAELDGSHKKAEQMRDVLENTQTHFSELETKYDQAKELLKNYQNREKELLEREETHVEKLREKDVQYSNLISQLKNRIDELEKKLDQIVKKKTNIVEDELCDIKEDLVACNNTKRNDAPPALPMHGTPRGNQSRHAGLSQKAMPLSAAPSPPQHYDRFIMNGLNLSKIYNPTAQHIYATAPLDDSIYAVGAGIIDGNYLVSMGNTTSNSKCESPVPRISEPASPAMPQKFLNNHVSHKNKILFPLRKRFIPAENEFWRENVEVQGLQVFQWNTDEVCQMLIHIGLDKYIPEFTVNQITGPKFLELDGNKLKSMGIYNHSDRSIIKKKIKFIKARIERERKILERNSRARAIATSISNKTISNTINGFSPQALKMISIHQ